MYMYLDVYVFGCICIWMYMYFDVYVFRCMPYMKCNTCATAMPMKVLGSVRSSGRDSEFQTTSRELVQGPNCRPTGVFLSGIPPALEPLISSLFVDFSELEEKSFPVKFNAVVSLDS